MNLATNTEDLALIKSQLTSKQWLVACLCAAWCDTCTAYRIAFDQLAEQHPDVCFAWIDIEDQAHLVDEIDIENFPTILIQHQDTVHFFGTMLPDTMQLHRLLKSIMASHTGTQQEADKIAMNTTRNDTAATKSAAHQGIPSGWSLRQLILNNA
ncbi:thioredoxin family protein [Undibacterium sp. RTI2.1]|uniref:thioredoxin family protein n=1 Tax=unclassified Undibacterium TaxID=2630295 RepID=UPI002B234205|nr:MULTISPECIES: thioredoxin family protein [unclassified Undibacterium]MEB0031744.1 thioredoxin family protein [Undibacterium sp. RTI2.1]MEB0117773.1 thioredoxin family protein [Undibacterium sp. RTI2.2]